MSGRLQAKAAALLRAEQGTVQRDWTGKLAVALAFPNTYQAAVADPAFQPSCRHLNRCPEVICERVVLPDPEDLSEYTRTRTPLFSLESQRPVTDFDLIAFSVGTEGEYANILQMLDMAGLPPLAADRTGAHPLLAMGGALTSGNPEPLADFFDLFLVGEGAEWWGEVLQAYRGARDAGRPRPRREPFLRRILPIEGVYVPRFYDVSYHPDGRVASVSPRGDAPAIVRKRRRSHGGDVQAANHPHPPGVKGGQADPLQGQAQDGRRIVTLAPRAGTERLRRVMGVGITDEEVFSSVGQAVGQEIPSVKLDFMIGLPAEAEEDVAAIPSLAKRVRHHMLQRAGHAGRIGEVSVTVSCFVPRPWTPFQWCGFEDVKRLEDKLRLIKGELGRVGNIQVTHDLPRWAYLQAFLARADRRAGGLLRLAHAAGGDWKRAFRAWHLNPDFTACRRRPLDEVFPWDHFDVGVTKEQLAREYEKAGLA